MNKFEKLIEYIINDEDSKARELFHQIVVEKSRDIYESIMDEEQVEETVHGAEVDDLVDEVSCEEETFEGDEEGEEEFPVTGDEFGGEEEVAGDEFGGEDEVASEQDELLNIDAKLDELLSKFDEIMGDNVSSGDEEFGGEEEVVGDEFGGEEEVAGEQDELLNIDAKLDELLSKFDEIMGDNVSSGDEEFGGEEEVVGDEFGGEEEVVGDEFGGEEQFAEGKNPFAGSGKSGKSGSGSAKSGKSGKSGSGSAKSGKSGKSASELMREYVEKIGDVYGGQGDASEGDAVGAAGKKTSVNTKPASVGPGADFGGNVVKTSTKQENQDGTTPTKASNEYNKGQGEIKSGNRNVPGGKADKLETTGKKYETSKEAEGQTTDGKVPVATKSVQKQNTGVKR